MHRPGRRKTSRDYTKRTDAAAESGRLAGAGDYTSHKQGKVRNMWRYLTVQQVHPGLYRNTIVRRILYDFSGWNGKQKTGDLESRNRGTHVGEK